MPQSTFFTVNMVVFVIFAAYIVAGAVEGYADGTVWCSIYTGASMILFAAGGWALKCLPSDIKTAADLIKLYFTGDVRVQAAVWGSCLALIAGACAKLILEPVLKKQPKLQSTGASENKAVGAAIGAGLHYFLFCMLFAFLRCIAERYSDLGALISQVTNDGFLMFMYTANPMRIVFLS